VRVTLSVDCHKIFHRGKCLVCTHYKGTDKLMPVHMLHIGVTN